MRRFGSDKPDLRNPLELTDIADPVKILSSLYLLMRQMIRKAVLWHCVVTGGAE